MAGRVKHDGDGKIVLPASCQFQYGRILLTPLQKKIAPKVLKSKAKRQFPRNVSEYLEAVCGCRQMSHWRDTQKGEELKGVFFVRVVAQFCANVGYSAGHFGRKKRTEAHNKARK